MKDVDCVQFLQDVLPMLGMRWSGFRKVRRQVCKRVDRRLRDLGLESVAAYRDYLRTTGKKVFQEMQAADPNFLIWTSAEMLYQGMEHGSDFDFVGAAVYSGTPPEPAAAPQMGPYQRPGGGGEHVGA